MKLTGLFFGSFNPIHNGHIAVARYMLQKENLDEVWFVVSPQSPLKREANMLPAQNRLEMVQAAVEGEMGMKAEGIELSMPMPSYTIDTLKHIYALHQDRKFVIIMGADNLVSFGQWKDSDAILEMSKLYVYVREGYALDNNQHNSVYVTSAPAINESATHIRELANRGENISLNVPEKVDKLIREKGYYR